MNRLAWLVEQVTAGRFREEIVLLDWEAWPARNRRGFEIL